MSSDLRSSKNSLIKIKEELAYDKHQDIYYSSHSHLNFNYERNSKIYIYFDDFNKTHHVLVENKNNLQEIKVIVTNTPILNIDKIKEKRRPIKTDYDKVIMTALETDPQKKAESYQIKMKIRGGSSLVYPKKSWSLIELNKASMSIYGLPENRKYVLNSMYEDEYKIRDVLGWDIWSESSAYSNEREIFNSTDMIYTEVFIDNEYQGMYGLQDHMNEHKLEFVDNKGSIYKFNNWVFPKMDEFDPQSHHWDSVEMYYSNLPDKKKWFGFDQYVKFFGDLPKNKDMIDEKVDMASFMDYYLFIEITNARDNLWKNRFMSRSIDNKKLMISPWDLDMTYGSSWTGQPPYLTESSMDYVGLLYNKERSYFISKMLKYHDTFERDSAIRYFELREKEWSKENLLGKIELYEMYLKTTGIYERDLERWPDSPKIGEGMEDFISEALLKKIDILDEHFEKVLEGDEQ